MKKAFDTVNHSIFLKKLKYYGVRGIPLQWFESYLSNRKQYVSINDYSSDELILAHGVSQGSVLEPLLLILIFINDLSNVSKLLAFYLFAYDTNIYYESSHSLNIQNIVNREFRKIRKWLGANKLALNIDKINFVIFHSYQHKLTDHIFLKIGRRKIKQVSCVKFLGLLLHSNLSWKFNLTELSKSLQGLLVCSTRFAIILTQIH